MATKKTKTTKKTTKKQVEEKKNTIKEPTKSTSDNFVNFHLKKGQFRELSINEKQFASILIPILSTSYVSSQKSILLF